MKLHLILAISFAVLFLQCKETDKPTPETVQLEIPDTSSILGKWKRMTPQGPMSIQFKENGIVEIDLGDDEFVDVFSTYSIQSDTITFYDKEGKSCPNPGSYKIYNRGFTISFDVLDDLCNGRIKITSGFWVRPNHPIQLKKLTAAIDQNKDSSLVLHRGRMYLALANSKMARKDFDYYLSKDASNAKVFIHRAATRFPMDLTGVVYDCNKAIALDSNDKNAYFLRGLAHYGLDEQQQGCDDFQKAIDLGFEILKEAEYNRCKNYW